MYQEFYRSCRCTEHEKSGALLWLRRHGRTMLTEVSISPFIGTNPTIPLKAMLNECIALLSPHESTRITSHMLTSRD